LSKMLHSENDRAGTNLFEQFFLNVRQKPRLKRLHTGTGPGVFDCRKSERPGSEGRFFPAIIFIAVFAVAVLIYFISNNVNMLAEIKRDLFGFAQPTLLLPEYTGFGVLGGISVKTFLLMGHVLGLMMGFGVAIFLDIVLVRHLYAQKITLQTCEIITLGSKLVGAGLALLWITGVGFLILYGYESPEKLANPKIWAKVPVVVVLTLNGFALHHYVLPQLKSNIGSTLWQDNNMGQNVTGLVLGAVSFASWLFAFALGMTREFNFTYSSLTFLTGYFAMITLSLAGMIFSYLIVNSLQKQPVQHDFLAP